MPKRESLYQRKSKENANKYHFVNERSSFGEFIEYLLFIYHLYLLGSVAHMEVCLDAALDGAKPNAFWIF